MHKTVFKPNNLRSLPKHYLTWWKDLFLPECGVHRNHKMCRSAKLIKWVGRQPEDIRSWAPGLRENVCRTSVTCWGGAGGSSKTRQIWSRWQPSPHISVSLFFGAMKRPTPTQWYNVVFKMGTLSVNCNTWFFLIKTIRGLWFQNRKKI